MNSILDKVLSSKHAEEIALFAPQEIVTKLLQTIATRERDVLVRRFGLDGSAPATLEEIGTSLEVTRERVRQVERSALKKIKGGSIFQSVMTSAQHVVQQYLEDAGGILSEDELIERLVSGRDHLPQMRAIVRFFLHELLRDRFQYIEATAEMRSGWATRLFTLEHARERLNVFRTILTETNTPLDTVTFLRRYREKQQNESLTDDQLQSLLNLSTLIEQNVFNEWGLASWQTIHPRRMKDKIYLVLKRAGKPLHFNDITKLINEAKFDLKVAHPPTVHNELIIDKRFVLVGRGTYALLEWGYKPGIVADVVADILQKEGKPLDRETIVREVLRQRFVGKATVHLALLNRARFTKLPDGRYALVQTETK